jgi:hypothetical protein
VQFDSKTISLAAAAFAAVCATVCRGRRAGFRPAVYGRKMLRYRCQEHSGWNLYRFFVLRHRFGQFLKRWSAAM